MAGEDLDATIYYGYPIEKESEGEFKVSIYCDSIQDGKAIIKRCLEAGIIEWPIETVGRRKK